MDPAYHVTWPLLDIFHIPNKYGMLATLHHLRHDNTYHQLYHTQRTIPSTIVA